MSKFTNIIGLMSGTSLDGLDICAVRFEEKQLQKFEIINCKTVPYNEQLRNKLKNSIYLSNEEISNLSIELGVIFGNATNNFIKEHNLKNIDIISCHGHTIFHEPDIGKTLQIGDGKTINKITRIKTINNFRAQDVALGGQGAPLVPIGDMYLFEDFKYCLNLGGFANISFKEENNIYAFDICPMNTVLNHYCKIIGAEFDLDGNFSKEGNINKKLFNQLNSISYYEKKLPKSLGIEFVNKIIFPLIENYKIEIKDILNTYIHHVAYQIKRNVDTENEILITGGGAYNKTLINCLKKEKLKIHIPQKEIVDYKEALIFAFLGRLKNEGLNNCLKSVTGASKDHSSGDVFNLI